MAIFRAMRVGGAATFANGPAVVVVPPVTGDKPRFRVMRAPNGSALFLGAAAGNVTPEEPGEYVPKNFEEQLTENMLFTYDAGDSQNFDDTLYVAMGFGYAAGLELVAFDALNATLALNFDTTVQMQVEDQMTSAINFGYSARARIRGWNDDSELPAAVWTPDPKPNLF